MRRFQLYEGHAGRFVGDRKLGPLVAEISKAAECRVNSHARDKRAASLLHAIGQHTQAEVIDLHAQGVPGYGPANPVSRTTHCRRNDGVAYPLPAGVLLPWWGRGIDVDINRRNEFCAEARKRGWVVTPTYPGAVGEAQHVNFRRVPRIVLPPLKRGSHGPRVRRLNRALVYLHRPDGESYLTKELSSSHFNAATDRAVRRFQRDHGLADDGTVGIHTQRAIRAAVRRRKLRLKGKD